MGRPDGDGGVVTASVSLARTADVPLSLLVAVAGAEQTVEVPAGAADAEVEVTLDAVERWWPAGYGDQPLYDVDVELRAQGFVPQAFVATKTWPLAPVQWAGRDAPTDEAHARQLVEADMLYVRDLARLDE